ncbi:MAG TPA: lipopolysaccharide transport periplasmic protein LptA [Candidatus Udaeobacter sp.]|jgi:lipopolysaccharide export system protein LptA|nr:lipopolysaccharide transport periplasmic protein LptA [Candidatus Udaeobacter sp.]
MHDSLSLLSRCLLVLLLSSAAVYSAADAPAPATEQTKKGGTSAFELSKKDPIYITADWMEVDQTKNTITYKGRVVTVQADMTMRSETLTAYYDPQMKQMSQIVAEGKVNATQGNRIATGEKAVFDDKAKTVTLTGNPVMRQGNSQVTGTKIVYFMEQDRAVAEGDGKTRVVATIFPEELKNQDKGDATGGKQK